MGPMLSRFLHGGCRPDSSEVCQHSDLGSQHCAQGSVWDMKSCLLPAAGLERRQDSLMRKICLSAQMTAAGSFHADGSSSVPNGAHI